MALAVVIRDVAEKWHLTHRDLQEEGHMQKASKGVAWMCIVSTLLMGCYSSVVVAPAEKERVHAGEYRVCDNKGRGRSVSLKVSVVANDTICGGWVKVTCFAQVNQEEDTILHSDVVMGWSIAVWNDEVCCNEGGSEVHL